MPLAVCAMAGFLFDARHAAADGRQKDAAGKEAQSDAALTEAEQAFVDLLTNSVLVGHFSVEGRSNAGAKAERYEISRVKKVDGDNWVVQARISYGKVDVAVPVPVHVHWAGDTPVISLTDLKILGLGEGFTTRVLFYKDRYAGSWYHGKVGGHMWGTIEKAPPDERRPGNDAPRSTSPSPNP
jgi:hypothetical protein